MMEYVLEYLEEMNVFASDTEEQDKLEEGILMFLSENGISEEDTVDYYRQYVLKRIQIINRDDIKRFFIQYPVISEVNQIVIEYNYDGILPKERVAELYKLMSRLYDCGLNDRYIPAQDVKQILG